MQKNSGGDNKNLENEMARMYYAKMGKILL
jgi:hypothetical protein